jgi:hypothetical protein
MVREWNPVRNGETYCSPACGAGCTYEAYKKAVKDADELASLCCDKIGGIWKPVVHENLGWHWQVVLEGTNISISYGGYLAKGDRYSIGMFGGTPCQVSLHPQTFESVEDAYTAQTAAVRAEANRWNDILNAIQIAKNGKVC